MRTSKTAVAAVALSIVGVELSLVMSGCMGDGGADCPAPPAPKEAGADAPDGDGAGPAMASLRFANFSPDAPEVDFCVAPHGTTAFQGPLVAGLATLLTSQGTAVDAGTPGVGYPGVSSYVSVPAVEYDVRMVVAGSPDCSSPLPAMGGMGTLALAPGGFGTIAAVGEASPVASGPPLQIVTLSDDTLPAGSEAGAPKLYIRFLHASPVEPALDFAVGSTTEFTQVVFGKTSRVIGADAGPDAGPKVDNGGYTTRAAIAPKTAVNLYPSGMPAAGPVLARFSAGANTGAILTFVLIGESAVVDSGAPPLQLLQCIDNGATTGLTSTCTPLPDMAPQ